MLVRFRQDVIALKPAVVVIQGGTNDVAGITGPGTRGTVSDNLMSMTELAQAHGIAVVIASILPICDCYPEPDHRCDRRSGSRTSTSGSGRTRRRTARCFLDYYSALAEGRNFKAALTSDGFLPNDAGYQVMAPLAERAIAEALQRPKTR